MRSTEQAILFLLVAAMYLVPGRLPYVPVSLHGVLLLLLLAAACLRHRSRLLGPRSWPYWALLGTMGISGGLAGTAGPDVARPMLFGVLTALTISAVGRRTDVRTLFYLLVPILVLDAALGVSIRLWLYPQAGIPDVLHDAMFRPFHRGAFLTLAMLAVGAAFVTAGQRWLLAPFVVLTAGAILTALRGVWVGAAIGLLGTLMLDRRWRSLILACVAALTFAGVQWQVGLMNQRTQELAMAIGSDERKVSAVEPPPPPAAPTTDPASAPVSRKEPAPPVAPPKARSAPSAAAPAVVTEPSPQTTQEAQAATFALDFSVKSGAAKFVEELSSAGRLGYWQAGLRMVRAYPWFGVGPGNFTTQYPRFANVQRRDDEMTTDSHSMYVGILAELGVVGFLVFTILLATAFVPVWHQRSDLRRRPELLGATVGVLGLCAVGLTWDIHLQRVWWLALALLALASERESAAHPA